MANKDKKNQTSFKPGNKAHEIWTKEETEKFFKAAYELSIDEITFVNIANQLNTYPDIFEYLLRKFPEFRPIKERIAKQLENNVLLGAMKGQYNPTITIFNLKNNYNWTDKTEINQKTEMTFKDIPREKLKEINDELENDV